MHKIAEKEFTIDDFSHEHLDIRTHKILEETIKVLNDYRNIYINYNSDDFEIKGCPSKKEIWWQMIQLLPSSYNQTRNVMLNYEVLANIYKSRKDHKLDEWREFCKWIESLPYSELIVSTSSGCENKVNKSDIRWAEDIFKNHGIKLTEAQIDAINSISTTNIITSEEMVNGIDSDTTTDAAVDYAVQMAKDAARHYSFEKEE
ncbi:hypothetical protein WKT03_04910 [Coprococcus sp. HCN-4056]|uniref:hypothetical protein n=1 Tax=Coprococcus sp. HCN-4056 TaxID=3134671 RepID=UPI0030C3EC94